MTQLAILLRIDDFHEFRFMRCDLYQHVHVYMISSRAFVLVPLFNYSQNVFESIFRFAKNAPTFSTDTNGRRNFRFGIS